MALIEELKKIKHLYGEEFMHLCRTNFPTILEKEGMLLNILQENFANNARTLAKDIESQDKISEFKKYVFEKYYQRVGKDHKEEENPISPYELLKSVGYNLYEAKNYPELLKYKKYYAKGEELCSFAEDRTRSCICFWAIKKDADMIRRWQFDKPEREDEYSTSVLAIQFDKFGGCYVSIKSRYNHTVANPDATYRNDLDKIVPGLTAGFKKLLKERGYNFVPYSERGFELKKYTRGPDDKLYKYNIRAMGFCFCPGNIVLDLIGKKVINLGNPEQQVLIDNYILDLKAKTLKEFDVKDSNYSDAFIKGFENIEKISRTKNKENGETTFVIYMNDKLPVTIITDEANQIVEYKNANLKSIENNFMAFNKALRNLEIPNVEAIGDSFLESNSKLRKLSLPNVKTIGMYFMEANEKLEKFEAPILETVLEQFLINNEFLTDLKLPCLRSVGCNFLMGNQVIANLEVPSLEKVDMGFMTFNKALIKLSLPSLKETGINFMRYNNSIERVDLPELEKADVGFLYCNRVAKHISAPKLKEVPAEFFAKHDEVSKIYKPYTALIDGVEFARLDAISRITNRELNRIGRAIEWFRRTTRNILNRNEDQNQDDR